jgi:hypothetical protein
MRSSARYANMLQLIVKRGISAVVERKGECDHPTVFVLLKGRRAASV